MEICSQQVYHCHNYYAVSVNAARGVAMQVYNAINSFTANFVTAFKPQLVQSYASSEMEAHYKLLFRASKFSYYLLLLIVIPVAFNLQALLEVWLEEVPTYTREFCLYIFVAYLFDALGSALEISVFANGKIKNLQIITAIVFVFGIIASFVMLKMGMAPYVVSIVTMMIHALMFVFNLYYAHTLCNVNITRFCRVVILPVIAVTASSLVVPIITVSFSCNFWSALALCVVYVLNIAFWIWFVGLQKEEKQYLISIVKHKIKR